MTSNETPFSKCEMKVASYFESLHGYMDAKAQRPVLTENGVKRGALP